MASPRRLDYPVEFHPPSTDGTGSVSISFNPLEIPNRKGSLNSTRSTTPKASPNPSRRDVYVNHAYDNCIPCEEYPVENQYEDLASIAAKTNSPRKKANDVYESVTRSMAARSKINELYEPTGPVLKERIRQITECSDDSGFSTYSRSLTTRQSCLGNLVLFLVLMFSMAAFVLVILMMYGKVGPHCGCNENAGRQRVMCA